MIFENDNMNSGNEKMSFKKSSALLDLVKTIGILLVAIVVSEVFLYLDVGNQDLIMIYLLTVLLTAQWTSHFIFGIISAIASTFAYDYFILVPRNEFTFADLLEPTFTLSTMLLATFIISTMTHRIRQQAKIASEREETAELLLEINRQLLTAGSVENIQQITSEYLSQNLDAESKFFVKEPIYEEYNDNGLFSTIEAISQVRRGFALPELQQKPDVSLIIMPVVSKDKVRGVIGVDNRTPLSKENLQFLQMLCGQVSFALLNQNLSDEQNHALMLSERERMRNTLLRSISHDLRTPLTSILGGASTILEHESIDQKTTMSLVSDIKANVQWLIRMVENILLITKISGDDISIDKNMEAVEEVVAGAIQQVRKRFPQYTFEAVIPDELLMAPMDATLITQVIINLLENAAKNSPNDLRIVTTLKQVGDYVQVDIEDNGVGIPARLQGKLFEAARTDRERVTDGARGVGIGLSICKTIVAAHGGTIEGNNRGLGGAKFSFKLPMTEE